MSRARSTDAHGPAWLVQAAHIARQFYLEGRSKVEIGDDLGLSRFKVARILEEARELGLVEVSIRLPGLIDAEASRAVAEHLALRRAIVLPVPDGDATSAVRTSLGRVAADLLTELVTDEDVLGLSCSRTVTATTQALAQLAPCEVVQLTGTLAGYDADTGSVESVRRAAVVGGGRAHPIYAPMLVPDAATAAALTGQAEIRQTLERVPDVTIAMVAVGGWSEGLSTVWSFASEAERREAVAAGAVGEIGGRLYTQAGTPLAGRLDARVVGMTLTQLHGIPEVIGLGHGEARAESARAAVAGGLVDTLVCDAALAQGLLALDGIEGPR